MKQEFKLWCYVNSSNFPVFARRKLLIEWCELAFWAGYEAAQARVDEPGQLGDSQAKNASLNPPAARPGGSPC